MNFTEETYNKIKFRHLAQQVLEMANEIYKNPNYKRASLVVKGGAGKKVFLKK